MATTVRFGRLPRSAPSLTATIVALSQQYEAQRERNLFDAWNQGGDWEGKEATDKVLMKFLKEKLEGLDPSDPNANATRIQIASYEFAIENSEMELKYAQGKVSDTGMASFYRKWAAKLPRDSEAYRDRATLAAQYADRAHAASSARSRAASDKAYYDRQQAVAKSQVNPYLDLFATIEDYARKGVIGYIAPALNTTGEGLADLRTAEMDATTFLRMLDQLNRDPNLAKWKQDYIDGVRARGGSISENSFTQAGIMAMADQAMAGIDRQIEIAKRAGRSSDVTALRKQKGDIKKTKSTVSTIDEKAEYEDARKEWTSIIADPSATLAEKIAANNEYKGTLLDLARRADRAGDTVAAGRYNTEFLAANGGRDLNGKEVDITGPTMWESSRETQADHPAYNERGEAQGDAYSTRDSVLGLEDSQRVLSLRNPDGSPVAVQVRLDDKGNPTWDTRYGFGVFDASGLRDVMYTVAEGDQGDPNAPVTAIVPRRIVANPETTDVNGNKERVQSGGKKASVTLGGAFTLADGTTLYSYRDSTGQTKYTDVNPFTSAVSGVPDDEGNLTVTVEVKTEAQKNTIQNKGVDPKGYVRPEFMDPSITSNQPNMVFNSPMAYEMAKDPGKAYSKYSPQEIDRLARAMAGGDEAAYASIRGEVDSQRAEYVKGGDMTFDQKMRVAASRRNGTMPLLSDYVGGVTVTGFNMRGTSLDTAENRALAEQFGGKTPDQIMADAVKERFGYTTDALAQAWKTGTALRYGPPAPGQTWATMAQQSRGLATNLVRDIWWQATQAPAAAPKPVTPGPSLPPTGGGRGYVPPIQQATPPPVAPKPTAPTPAPAPAPSMPPTGAGRGWTPTAVPKPTPLALSTNPYRNIFTYRPPSGPAAGPTASYSTYTGFRLW